VALLDEPQVVHLQYSILKQTPSEKISKVFAFVWMIRCGLSIVGYSECGADDLESLE
jgi:hypothetical protein